MPARNAARFFYVTSYQNDQVHEILGKVAQDRGYKRVYLLEPNYQAGKDSAAGFKIDYKGEIVEESYVPLGTLDFQAELSKIAALKPDAVFTFMPGGMGVNLVKQYKQAGLADRIPFLSAFTVDESTLPGAAGCRGRHVRRLPTGRPISTPRRTRSSWRAMRLPITACPRLTRSRPMMRRC